MIYFIFRNLSHQTNKKTLVRSVAMFLFLQIAGGSDSKASAYNAGDPGSIPGS